MAKHKKPAPAAKKPAAKPAKAVKKSTSIVPAKKPESHHKASEKKVAKPAPAKAAAKAEPAPTAKSRPPIAPAKAPEKKPSGKTTPPVEVKPAAKPSAHTEPKVATGKTTPPIAAKPTAKSNPPVPVKPAAPAAAAAAKPAKPLSEKAQAKADAREALRSRILGAKRASKPIALTLDEVREIAKTAQPAAAAPVDETAKATKTTKGAAKPDLSKIEKPATPNHIKAASLADILGFNPKKTQKASPAIVDPEEIPEKYRRYYRLLIDLRSHILEGLNLHTEETLKRSAKDDAGDLSSYGQHMADAGTDTFDRDFALSLVSSEQEALTEIEAAIKRIHDGTYGICEASGKPIAKERLTAVPFTRYSAEAQKEIEKNRMRTRSAPGLFGELGEEGGRIADDDAGGDE